MDIDSPTGQQIYRSIERGHMVPIPTGFRDDDSGWHYHLTNMDYLVRRMPSTGQLERIYLGMDEAIPVDSLDANEHIRVDSPATYDQLLSPPTLPFNVKRNVRPHGYDGRELLDYCRSKQWVVDEHDPGKWPYFEKPFPRGVSSNMVQSVFDMHRAGWPVNHTQDKQTGLTFGDAHAGLPPPYAAEPDAPPPIPTAQQRRADRHARWVAQEAQWHADNARWAAQHPFANNALAVLGATIVVGGVCLVGALVGTIACKTYRALHSQAVAP